MNALQQLLHFRILQYLRLVHQILIGAREITFAFLCKKNTGFWSFFEMAIKRIAGFISGLKCKRNPTCASQPLLKPHLGEWREVVSPRGNSLR